MNKMFHHMLLITNIFPLLLQSSSWQLYKSTTNTIICQTEYQEQFNFTKNVLNFE